LKYFTNKVVIITGASRGVGKELALKLSLFKTRLCLIARNETALLKVTEQCKALGAQVLFTSADITDKQQCEKTIALTAKQYGGIDILINCAAKHYLQFVDETFNFTDAKMMFDTNYWGSVYCTYYALPYIKRSRGQIVVICSILGKIVSPGNSVYCSSKFASSAFFETLRIELQNDKVGVTLVYPGYLKERMENSEKQMSALKLATTRYFGMTAAKCAERIIDDIYHKRESDIFPFYAKVAVWMNIFFPKLLKFAIKVLNRVRVK
jgi:short-subunit dehydrogenase